MFAAISNPGFHQLYLDWLNGQAPLLCAVYKQARAPQPITVGGPHSFQPLVWDEIRIF